MLVLYHVLFNYGEPISLPIGGTPIPGTVSLLLPLVAISALSARMGLMGLFASDVGVRQRSMWSTRTFAWQNIAMFDIRPATRSNFTRRVPFPAVAVWIVPKNGRPVQTDLLHIAFSFASGTNSKARFQAKVLELQNTLARNHHAQRP